MKKIVCFIFFVLLSLNVEAMVIHGQLDDGFMLGEGESQHQFLLGLDAMLFNQLHGAYQQLNIFSFPFYNGVYQIKGETILSGSPLMLLPMATFGYIARWHVLKNFEINFNVFSSTPSPGQCVIMSNAINWFKNDRNSPFYSTYHDDNNYPYNIHFYSIDTIFFMNLWGVPTSVGIGFKKNIREDENSSFSYKFNLGLDYTGDAHGGISIKNSFLFARKLP